MDKKLSELFLEQKKFTEYQDQYIMTLEDVKIYGEIVRMEQIYNNGFWGYARPELNKLAQEHGITDYNTME